MKKSFKNSNPTHILFYIAAAMIFWPIIETFLGLNKDLDSGIGSMAMFIGGLVLFFFAGSIGSATFLGIVVSKEKTLSRNEKIIGTLAVIVIIASISYPFVCGPNSIITCVQ